MNKCLFCKKETTNKKFCNHECYRNYLKSKLHKVCPVCKLEFNASHKKQIYCSNKCASKAKNYDEIKNKRKATLLKRYGVEHQSQLESVKEKIREHRKNGSYNDVSKSMKITLKEKYGSENYVNVDKMKSTKLKKYGDENYNNRQKAKETLIKKYGVPYVPSIKNLLGIYKKETTKNIVNKMLQKENLELINEYIGKRKKDVDNKIYQIQYNFKCKICDTTFLDSLYYDIPRCPKCNPKKRSEIQQGLFDFLTTIYLGLIIENDRTQIYPFELDFYIPDKKLAIELNGILYHSEIFGLKNKNYHLNKTNMCNSKGIKLLHIFENEWIHKTDIVKSIIKYNLGIYDRIIYARECKIKEINLIDKDIFLETNHLQGKDISSIRYGLFYKDELVSVMTFSKSRFNKNVEYEMVRFCNKINTKVIGSASKLFKHFIKNTNPHSIISYADRRYFNGKIYNNLKFEFIENTTPNYFYFNFKNPLELINRMNFQKHKLFNILEKYDGNISEWENMQLNGYDRIWDCGNKKFVWKK